MQCDGSQGLNFSVTVEYKEYCCLCVPPIGDDSLLAHFKEKKPWEMRLCPVTALPPSTLFTKPQKAGSYWSGDFDDGSKVGALSPRKIPNA